jgi:hypothetical protein
MMDDLTKLKVQVAVGESCEKFEDASKPLEVKKRALRTGKAKYFERFSKRTGTVSLHGGKFSFGKSRVNILASNRTCADIFKLGMARHVRSRYEDFEGTPAGAGKIAILNETLSPVEVRRLLHITVV